MTERPIRFTTLDFILSVAGLVAWGLSLIGVVTSLFLGSAVLIVAFALIAYEFWKWSRVKGWNVATQIAVVFAAVVVVLWSGSKQVIYEYHQEHPTSILVTASPQPTLAVLPTPITKPSQSPQSLSAQATPSGVVANPTPTPSSLPITQGGNARLIAPDFPLSFLKEIPINASKT